MFDTENMFQCTNDGVIRFLYVLKGNSLLDFFKIPSKKYDVKI